MERARHAPQLLEDFERTTVLADRVDRAFDRALDSYTKTVNASVPAAEPRNEPNPDM